MEEENSDVNFDSDDDVHVESHNRLLGAISRLYKKQRVENAKRTEPAREVSEFHLSAPGCEGGDVEDRQSTAAATVGIKDLLSTLNAGAKQKRLKDRWNTIKGLAATLPAPLEKNEADKIKRSVAYEDTKTHVSRWDGLVEKNRLASELSFPLPTPKEKTKYQPLEFARTFTKPNELELKLAEVLGGSHVHKKEQETEQKIFKLSMKEMIKQRQVMKKIKAQESFKIVKAIKQNKIKSKKYRRLLRKEKAKEELKEFEALKAVDPEAALERLQKDERERALERASLRHRNTGRWAKGLAVRAKYDKEARKELAEQVAKSRELTLKKKLEEEAEDAASSEEDENGDKIFKYNPWTCESNQEDVSVSDFMKGYQMYWRTKKSEDKTEDHTVKGLVDSNPTVEDPSMLGSVLPQVKDKSIQGEHLKADKKALQIENLECVEKSVHSENLETGEMSVQGEKLMTGENSVQIKNLETGDNSAQSEKLVTGEYSAHIENLKTEGMSVQNENLQTDKVSDGAYVSNEINLQNFDKSFASTESDHSTQSNSLVTVSDSVKNTIEECVSVKSVFPNSVDHSQSTEIVNLSCGSGKSDEIISNQQASLSSQKMKSVNVSQNLLVSSQFTKSEQLNLEFDSDDFISEKQASPKIKQLSQKYAPNTLLPTKNSPPRMNLNKICSVSDKNVTLNNIKNDNVPDNAKNVCNSKLNVTYSSLSSHKNRTSFLEASSISDKSNLCSEQINIKLCGINQTQISGDEDTLLEDLVAVKDFDVEENIISQMSQGTVNSIFEVKKSKNLRKRKIKKRKEGLWQIEEDIEVSNESVASRGKKTRFNKTEDLKDELRNIDDMFDKVEDEIQMRLQERLNRFERTIEDFEDIADGEINKNYLDEEEEAGKKAKKRGNQVEVNREGNSQSLNNISVEKEKIDDALLTLNKSEQSKLRGSSVGEILINPNEFMVIQPRRMANSTGDITLPSDLVDDRDDDETTKGNTAKDLQEAFADDDLVSDFRKEKADAENVKHELDLTLPGWGSWGGIGIGKGAEKKRGRRRKRFLLAFGSSKPQYPKKHNVIINEDSESALKDIRVKKLPAPFVSGNDFMLSVKPPIGPDWQSEVAVDGLTRSSVKTHAGCIIRPMADNQLKLYDKKVNLALYKTKKVNQNKRKPLG